MKKLLLRLFLIIIGSLLCQSLFSQPRYWGYNTHFLSETIQSVRLRLSDQDAGDNTFYPSSKVQYGITMTNTNNLVDRSGHWEFMCVGKRKGLAYVQGWETENWVSTIGLDEGYAYIARAKEGNTNWHIYVKIYCNSFLIDASKNQERGIIGAVIEYVIDDYSSGAVSPEIFEEGFQVYDPLMANCLLDHADKNHDALISREERYAITELFLIYQDPLHLRDGNTCLQYFPNLKTLDIGPYTDGKENKRVYQGTTYSTNFGYGIDSDRLIIENPNLDTIRINFRNQIKHVDLSKCSNLKKLIMYDASCIDIVLPPSIEAITTIGNDFAYMDLSTYNKLYFIAIDESNCHRLILPSSAKTVYCAKSQLSSIDLSRCKNLESLFIQDNKLTSLDLSQCNNLTELICWSNPLKSLDVRNNERLELLYCSTCDFSELDLTKNKRIEWLQVQADGFENKLKKIYLPVDHIYNGKYYSGNHDHPTDFRGIEIIYR